MIKFKPRDFEECLMGLPIKNWLMVDTIQTEDLNNTLFTRPQMAIGHLEELKGVTVDKDRLIIKGYTRFDDIFSESKIPSYYKEVLKKAKEMSMGDHSALGCYLDSIDFDCYIDPMLVALDGKVTLKSYIEERELDIVTFMQNGNVNFGSNNELVYSLDFKLKTFDFYDSNLIVFKDISGPSTFSYFIASNFNEGIIEEIVMTIMLPNRSIKSLDVSKVFKDQSDIVWEEPYISSLQEMYDEVTSSLKPYLKNKKSVKIIFRDLIEEPIRALIKHQIQMSGSSKEKA